MHRRGIRSSVLVLVSLTGTLVLWSSTIPSISFTTSSSLRNSFFSSIRRWLTHPRTESPKSRRDLLAQSAGAHLNPSRKVTLHFDQADALEIYESEDGVVCRIPGPCITRGRVDIESLPDWLTAYRELMQSKCRVRVRGYYKNAQHNSTYEVHPGDTTSNGSVLVNTMDLDYIGGSNAYHYHIPHFAQQLGLPLFIVETLFAPEHSVNYSAYGPDGTEFQRQRPSAIAIHDALWPAFLFQERTARYPLAASWVKQFFQLVPTKKPPIYIYVGKEEPVTQCFRSIVVGVSSRFQLRDLNPLLHSNGISKRPSEGQCRKQIGRVLILQREKDRLILNVDEVQRAVEKVAGKFFGRVVTQIETFEGANFSTQLSAMQKADIFITPHGAGVTNAAFLHRDSFWMEVFPFMYRPSIFAMMNTWLFRASGHMLDAPPDLKGFKEKITAQKRNESQTAQVLTPFAEAIEAYETALAAGDPDPVRTSQKNAREAHTFLNANFREGLRNQYLQVESDKLTQHLTKWATERCQDVGQRITWT